MTACPAGIGDEIMSGGWGCWACGMTNRVPPGKEHISIAVSGAYGGRTIDFRQLAQDGMTLVGLTKGYANGQVQFATDLSDRLAAGDAYYLDFLDQCDAYVAANGLNFPLEPKARTLLGEPDCAANPIQTLDLAESGISTVIWATGYRPDFSWVDLGRSR